MQDKKEMINLDKWDYIVATSSGALTATMDVLLIKNISLNEAHKWGVDEAQDVVIKVAKKVGFNGNDIAGAIAHLEEAYPIPADKLTNDFGGGYQHHLRDFSHHPTIVGLIMSIMTQFTGKGYGTDTAGNFITVELPEGTEIPGDFVGKIYAGIVFWAFHMVSDVAGSSSSAAKGSDGTGLPGPLVSFLKELSSIPAVSKMAGQDEKGYNKFSVKCSKLFNGTLLGEHDENGKIIKGAETKFDLRTEIGIGHEALVNKQYLPVLANELLVRAFYSVRRFINELEVNQIEDLEDITKIDPDKYLPWKSKPLKHMLMISSATFSTIDITTAGVKAYIKNKDNPSGFAKDFIEGINIFGAGRLVVAANSEMAMGISKLHSAYKEIAETQLAYVGVDYENAKHITVDIAGNVNKIAHIASPMGYVNAVVDVYELVSVSLEELKIARENRIVVEQQCKANIAILRENREQINMAVTEYMSSNLALYETAFNTIENAIESNDIEGYISGNKMIQKQLGRNDGFGSMAEFDELMASDDDFKL